MIDELVDRELLEAAPDFRKALMSEFTEEGVLPAMKVGAPLAGLQDIPDFPDLPDFPDPPDDDGELRNRELQRQADNNLLAFQQLIAQGDDTLGNNESKDRPGEIAQAQPLGTPDPSDPKPKKKRTPLPGISDWFEGLLSHRKEYKYTTLEQLLKPEKKKSTIRPLRLDL